MTWGTRYLGIPYRDTGDTRDGANCWGFFRLVMADRGVEVPMVGIRPRDLRALLEAFKRPDHPAREGWGSVQIQAAADGDALLFAHRPGWPDHVGIYLAHRLGCPLVLHCTRGIGSVIEPLDRLMSRGWREVTAWRHA